MNTLTSTLTYKKLNKMTLSSDYVIDNSTLLPVIDQYDNMLSDLSVSPQDDLDSIRSSLSTIISRFGGNKTNA